MQSLDVMMSGARDAKGVLALARDQGWCRKVVDDSTIAVAVKDAAGTERLTRSLTAQGQGLGRKTGLVVAGVAMTGCYFSVWGVPTWITSYSPDRLLKSEWC